jgi:hypothetical protein
MNMLRLTASLLVLALASACTDDGNDNSNTGGSGGSATGGTGGTATGGTGGSATGGTGGTATGGTGGSATGGTGGSATGGTGGTATGGSSSGGSDAGHDAGGEPDAGADASPGAGGSDSGGPDGGQAGLNCPMPTDGLFAVFRVADTEYFSAQITDPVGMQQAIDLWTGASTANIPNGALVCEPADYNCGYNWHLDPADIQFADVTIEVCDGTPSYLEDHCADFGARYCTWAAELIELYDCRIDGCPLVAK